MNVLISILFSLVSSSLFCQIYASVGVTRQTERQLFSDYFEFHPLDSLEGSFNNLYLNDYANATVGYRYKNFLFDLEGSYLKKEGLYFRKEEVSGTDYPIIETTNTSIVDFSFFGVQLSASYLLESKSFLFKKAPNNESAFGLNIRGDFSIAQVETNNWSIVGTKDLMSNGGEAYTSMIWATSDSKTIQAGKPTAFLGFHAKHSLMFEHFFVGARAALSIGLNPRYTMLNILEQPSYHPVDNLAFEAKVFVGYKFNWK